MTDQDKKTILPASAMPDEAIPLKGTCSFSGGIHPKENKHYTQDRSIESFGMPKQVAIMLSQHIGAVCKPLVSKRDRVEAGQVIGDIDAFVSSPVHAPLAGTVKDIALKSHPVLGREKAIVIDVDPEANQAQAPQPERFRADFDEKQYPSEQICQAVKKAGIVGMGGAGFPTRVKLEPNPEMPKSIILINACECEPFITCDNRMMLEWGNQIIAGIKLACRAVGCYKVKIGIEDNKPDAIKAMTKAVRNSKNSEHIQVVPVKTKYPQGGERQLIQALTGKTVPTGSIPPVIGVVVLNVATCAAIAEAVVYQQPLTHRVVTVTGSAIVKPGNYYVPIGTSVGELIEFCGGLKETAAKVVMGGPMMGFAIADMDTPLTKTSGSITILNKDDVTRAKFSKRQTPCIRCGRCLQACPEKLNPTKLAHAVKKNMLDIADSYYLSACIECGCCSYVCPANLEITGYIKTGKLLKARQKSRVKK